MKGYFKLIEHNTQDQINFGNCEDTRKYLFEEDIYLGNTEVHRWHTKIWIHNHAFNSVCFKEVEIKEVANPSL